MSGPSSEDMPSVQTSKLGNMDATEAVALYECLAMPLNSDSELSNEERSLPKVNEMIDVGSFGKDRKESSVDVPQMAKGKEVGRRNPFRKDQGERLLLQGTKGTIGPCKGVGQSGCSKKSDPGEFDAAENVKKHLSKSLEEVEGEATRGYEGSEDCSTDNEQGRELVPTRRKRTDSGSSIPVYACPFENCGKEFNRPWRLVEHKRSHTGERPHKCPEEGCDRTYTRKQHLQRHTATAHRETKPQEYLKCEECSKFFKNKYILSKHLYRAHVRERYRCEECGQEFRKQQHLRTHSYEHTGIKPYGCEYPDCNARFTIPSRLKRHALQHEKNCYVCPNEFCKQTFDLFVDLRKHLAMNHPKGADLQKKWKNLRTCFKREYNLQTKEPSGSGSKKQRKYLYFDQLLFLKDSLEQRTTASNLGETNNPTDGTEEEDEVSETVSQSTPRPKNITCRKRKPDSRQKTYEESLLEILKQKRDEEQEIDEDRYFLLSLLPEFKKFSEDQKYYAKTEMMTLMRRIRLSGNSNSQMFAYHNHNVAAPATTHQTMAMNSTVPVPPPQQISTNEPLPLTYQALSPDQEWDEDDEPNSSKTAVEYIKQVSTSGTAESSRASVPFVSSFKTPVRISHRERECHIGHKKERPMDKDSFLDIQEDKCDIFGKFVATGLRKLIGVQRVSAEKQILEVLYDCLLNTVSSSSQCLLPNEDQHTLERPDYSATLAGSR